MEYINIPNGFQLPKPEISVRKMGWVQVFPDSKYLRPERKLIETYPFSYLIVEADPPEDPDVDLMPADFDEITLRWAIKIADSIFHWSARKPHYPNRIAEWLRARAKRRSIVTIVLSTEQAWLDWQDYISRRAKSTAEVLELREASQGAA